MIQTIATRFLGPSVWSGAAMCDPAHFYSYILSSLFYFLINFLVFLLMAGLACSPLWNLALFLLLALALALLSNWVYRQYQGAEPNQEPAVSPTSHFFTVGQFEKLDFETV